MKRHTRDDLRFIHLARKLRAAAAVCVFGIVGALWLQAEIFASQISDASSPAAVVAPGADANGTLAPDAENPSARQL